MSSTRQKTSLAVQAPCGDLTGSDQNCKDCSSPSNQSYDRKLAKPSITDIPAISQAVELCVVDAVASGTSSRPGTNNIPRSSVPVPSQANDPSARREAEPTLCITDSASHGSLNSGHPAVAWRRLRQKFNQLETHCRASICTINQNITTLANKQHAVQTKMVELEDKVSRTVKTVEGEKSQIATRKSILSGRSFTCQSFEKLSGGMQTYDLRYDGKASSSFQDRLTESVTKFHEMKGYRRPIQSRQRFLPGQTKTFVLRSPCREPCIPDDLDSPPGADDTAVRNVRDIETEFDNWLDIIRRRKCEAIQKGFDNVNSGAFA